MSIIQDISRGLENGYRLYEERMSMINSVAEVVTEEDCLLANGDNSEFMLRLLASGYEGKLKSIYIDPPFFTKAKYNATISIKDADNKSHKIHHLAYDDTFDRNLEFYIENMTLRLLLMKELLADDGLMWVHLDWHSSHYIKLVLDEIMGEKNFINEIIWKYKSGGSGKKHFSRKHDSILVYSKTSKYYLNVPQEKSYNRGLKPYRFKGVEEYRDEFGWYTLVNMKDVWSIDMVGRTSKERTGYATQKPLELMQRIIEASTKEGDLCADFFCGSGSYLEAANKLGRRWIGCDLEGLAVAMARKRLSAADAVFEEIKLSENEAEQGRFVCRVDHRDELESGKSLYRLAIDSFIPDPDIGHIQLKERELVLQIAEQNAEQLIDYIMIDPNYDGNFNAESIITDGFDNIKCISRGNIALTAVDVFGKSYLFVF
ncbi:MAG: site-specific DNA-methyltransferase [Firmicutes bacterium]|nr:site-specific DNA-methyltransferase [Bacillota bacterium]